MASADWTRPRTAVRRASWSPTKRCSNHQTHFYSGAVSMALIRRKHRRNGFAFQPVIEALEERCVPSVDPILEWNAVAIEVNRISYSGGVVNDQIGPTRSSRA